LERVGLYLTSKKLLRGFNKYGIKKYALFYDIKQCMVVMPYGRFGTTIGQEIQKERPYLPLKIGPTGCPETSVRNFHYTLRNNPEDRRCQALLAEA
jgi:hypothetical protein